MSDFDTLQLALQRSAQARQADERACEHCLNALYHAVRRLGGPGLPLNNASLELTPDPFAPLRPAPVGSFHAAWLRVGMCEVLVRVRRDSSGFHGEYGRAGRFHLPDLGEGALQELARALLRGVAGEYSEPVGRALN